MIWKPLFHRTGYLGGKDGSICINWWKNGTVKDIVGDCGDVHHCVTGLRDNKAAHEVDLVRFKMSHNQDGRNLLAVIGDEARVIPLNIPTRTQRALQDSITGLLLAGIGHVGPQQKKNFLIVDSSAYCSYQRGDMLVPLTYRMQRPKYQLSKRHLRTLPPERILRFSLLTST